MKLNKTGREKLRLMFGGKCAYCGCELGRKWHADHIVAVIRKADFVKGKGWITTGECYRPEYDRKENLFPSCAPCNIDKGVCGLEEWRQYLHHRIVDRLRVNSSTFRHAERFGVVSINSDPLVFWFEKYQAVNEV